MKISVPLLFSIAYSAPGPNQEPEYLDSGERSLDTACSDLGDEFIIVAQDNAYNGQSGKLTLNKQSSYMPKGFVSIIGSCSEQIGQQCKYGVGIKWNMTFPTGLYNGYAPYILIAVYYDTESGEMKYTERYYGENNKYTQYNLPREFEIPNTNNVRIYIYGNKTQYSLHALAEIEWECLNYDPEFPMSNIVATNTWQMANAVLTNGFTPQMAENYGCTGRGLFDAYGPTIGPATDYIDTAFLTWKKCVKCASSENEDNIVPYWYDATSDSCGDNIDTKQDFCECDRALMNVLKHAPADTGYSMYPSDQCVHPCTYPCKSMYVPLSCCKWNENFWAAYNPKTSCCGNTGVHQIGTCSN